MSKKKGRPAPRDVEALVTAAQQAAARGELAEAEARYREALASAPDHLGLLSLLGILLVERDDADAAIDLLERARAIAPDFAPVQLALGSAYAAAGHDDLAISAMDTAVKLDPSSTLPLERLAKHHIAMQRPREAVGALRRILRRDPGHAQARFLLAGLTNDVEAMRTLAPPADWIADLFDTYAPRFDKHLVEGLQYSVPRSLAALVDAVASPGTRDWRVLDLGCGTGLAGVELRGAARELIGVDLSPQMIARARQRGIYDALHCEELTTTLARTRDVDLVVAADVFIYVGALEATFAGCAQALRSGGLLAFSVERHDGAGYVLQGTLRYAHADTYVRSLAEATGFTVERAEPAVLRVDNGQPAHGVLYVLRR